MFRDCSKLSLVETALPNLNNGNAMFLLCRKLTSWNIELPKLVNGTGMFYATGLVSWNLSLPNVTQGWYMFRDCTSLLSWNGELPNLTEANTMFGYTKITSWAVDLPKLVDGTNMFSNCKSLSSFRGVLPSLSNGTGMFKECILDAPSVLYILRGDGSEGGYGGMPAYMDGTAHDLGLGKRTNFMYSQEVADCFDEKPTVDSEHPLPAGTYHCKGWTITVQA